MEFGTKPITTSILKGLLTPFVGETVNFVNAPVMAKERGIRIIESTSEKAEDFASLVSITTRSKREQNTLAGTLFGRKELRIVRLNDFIVETVPEGHILLIHSYDKPGVLGNLGMMLASQNINIATMHLGRERIGGKGHLAHPSGCPFTVGKDGRDFGISHIISVRQITL